MKPDFQLLSCAMVLAAFGGLTISSSTLATAPSGHFDVKNTYYSDASHSTVVGTRHYKCNGALDSYGQITAYATVVQTECSGGSEPPDTGGGGGWDWPTPCTTTDPVYGCH